MKWSKSLFFIFLFFIFNNTIAQVCNNLGQNPASAFPVCGTATFNQNSVPVCSGQTVPAPGCTDNIYADKNPYYYKFTCFQSGTLNFIITPNTNSDDYDWSLYDITGQNSNTIFTNASLTIASNWSGDGGTTGMDNSGTNQYVCGGYGKPTWTKPSNLIVGHNYLLMISHFTDSQSGYSLSFGGGTAVITDPTPPHLIKANTDCSGKNIKVTLSKKMLCNSITATGSEFYLTPGNINVINASSINCSSNFDTDTIHLQLSAALPAGLFTLHIKNGTDNNTIIDYCNNQIPTTDSINFGFTPAVPTPIDSIAPPQCATNFVKLIFNNKQIKCNSIAADGSDFSIAGTYPVNIVNATAGACNNGTTDNIILQLNKTLYTKGTFTITLKTGTDGTTIVDECDQTSPIGSSKSFSVKDTVNADFIYTKNLGCITDTINVIHPIANEVNSWKWFVNDTLNNANTSNAAFYFTQFGFKNIQLIASNGFCTDTSFQAINLDNYIKADFNSYQDFCPKDTVKFTSNAEGINLSYLWNFGDANTAFTKDASHNYFNIGYDKTYDVTYTISNNLNCTSSITKQVNILKMCGEYIPTAFTPNGDGVNDTFGPLYAVKALNLVFKVYNRWGQKMFETNNWRQPWNGKYKNVNAADGIYVWYMQYINRDDNKPHFVKGTVTLLR